MQVGLRRRLGRVFRSDDRSVTVALDHGFFTTDVPDIAHLQRVVAEITDAGCDAVLATPGLASQIGPVLDRVGLILRLDAARNLSSWSGKETIQRYMVEDALALGADAVVLMAITHTPAEDAALTALAETVNAARRYAVPVLAEMLPVSYAPTPENAGSSIIAASCRLAYECGASMVKTRYSTDGEFASVVAHVGLPVMVLGGARTNDDLALLRMIEEAVHAGAHGVAMGRNVWQHPHPGAMTRAIAAVVHEGATAQDAATRYLR